MSTVDVVTLNIDPLSKTPVNGRLSGAANGHAVT